MSRPEAHIMEEITYRTDDIGQLQIFAQTIAGLAPGHAVRITGTGIIRLEGCKRRMEVWTTELTGSGRSIYSFRIMEGRGRLVCTFAQRTLDLAVDLMNEQPGRPGNDNLAQAQVFASKAMAAKVASASLR
jgi:hypothetical protein